MPLLDPLVEGKIDFGTRSTPERQNGLHLSILQLDKSSPAKKPCFLNAVMAYSEHDGWNLQQGLIQGDIIFL